MKTEIKTGGETMIYDFHQDIGYLALAFYALLCLLLLAFMVWLGIHLVKLLRKGAGNFNKIEIGIRSAIILVTLIPFVFCIDLFSSSCAKVYRLHTETYLQETGTLSFLTAERDDYRDDIMYDVSFIVNGVSFANNNLVVDEALLEKLRFCEQKTVTVAYELTEDGVFVYFIEVID
jgi:hypothetical protein